MKKIKLLFSAVASIACLSTLASCVDYGSGKERSKFSDKIDKAYVDAGVPQNMIELGATPEKIAELKYKMNLNYGENKEIKGSFNEELGIETKYGTYVGKGEADGVVSWKGIPYAKAPINELRWKPAQKLDESKKVYEAFYFGHTAIQLEGIDEPVAFYPQGEDCLNLNIWSNFLHPNEKKPVMVWIHGGGYIQGGATESEYDGTNFVTYNPDVVYVSIDYRVDMLGFINLTEVPGGEEYKESANLGLLDEVAALQWIKENISGFGGDPDRVTIFGESAGGGSCSALTIMPQAKGLFKRAIIQSGSVTNLLRTKEKSISHTKQILDITGAKNMEDLLALTPNDIRKLACIRDLAGPTSYTYPELDGVVLPKNIKEVIDEGSVRDGIDIMSGTTADEYDYWTKIMTKTQNEKFSRLALQDFENNYLQKQEDKDRYNELRSKLSSDPYQKDVETISYMSFHTPCRYEATKHSNRQGNKVYQYIFSEKSAPVPTLDQKELVSFGAYHGFELEFLFANYGVDLACSLLEAFRLSLIMQRMWVNFADRGDPSIREGDLGGVPAIKWDAYDSTDEKVMNISATECVCEKDPLSDNIKPVMDLFWNKVKTN